MPRLPSLAALLVLLAAGCDAAGLGLGVGTQCAAEKQQIRRRHGVADDIQEGVRSEFWRYFDERIAYEFSWDQQGEGCSVRTVDLVLLPPPL